MSITLHARAIADALAAPGNAGEQATRLHQLYSGAEAAGEGDAFVLALVGELLFARAQARLRAPPLTA